MRWLSPLLVTPAFHHWHHADEPDAVNTNYGAIFTVWDRAFGSWHLPNRMPTSYGITATSTAPMPESWIGQLAHPFHRQTRLTPADSADSDGTGNDASARPRPARAHRVAARPLRVALLLPVLVAVTGTAALVPALAQGSAPR